MARPSEFASIYLDSSAFIAVIKKEPGCEPIEEVLELADRRQIEVYASPVLLVEVRGQGRGGTDAVVEQQALAILSGARLINVEFHRHVALRARDYVGQYRLRPLDAIHLASAVEAEVEVMWTLDRDFSGLWQSSVEGVWIDEPYEIGPPRLI